MKLKNLTYILLAGTVILTACNKEEPQPEPDPETPTASAAQLASFFENNKTAAIQNFTIDATAPTPITGSQGTVVTFWANSFVDGQGAAVTGNVDIQLTEIYNKKDMIFQNAQTLGNNNGTLQPLISGGEFNITASQNGQPVSLAPGWSYNVQVQAPAGTNPNMSNFYSSGSDTLVWNPQDSSFWQDNGNSYDMYFDSLGWINCDVFMSDPNPQTEVQVDVPNGFNNTNCAVFVSFDGMNAMTMVYDYNGTNFTTGQYYTLPEGLAVHFVVIAFINNTPHAAIQGATLTNGHIEVIPALNATTEAQLASDIQNLP